jgi:hypothetical protein
MSLPREALRLSSGPASKCLEFRFYNRRFASRAPAETPPSETVRRAPWENPPAFDFQILLEPRVSAIAEEDAGPPRGHPASDSRALDGALPASGRSTATLFRAFARGGKSVAALSAKTTAPSMRTL